MLLQTRFERVWAVYPRGAAKKLAWRVFSRLKPDDALTDRMIAAVQFQKRTVWGGVDPKHIPHLRTWLEQERWTDATDDVAPVGQLELADARRWRQQKFLGRCPHAEACSTDEDCLKVIALRRRAPGTGPSRRDTFQERDRLKAGDDRLEAGDVVPPPVTRSPEESPERDETACPVCGRESCEDVTACLREQHQVFRDLEDVFGPVEFVTVSRCGALHKNA